MEFVGIIKFLLIDILRRTSVIKTYFHYKKIYANKELLIKEREANYNNFIRFINDHPFFKKIIKRKNRNSLSSFPITDKKFIAKNFSLIFNPNLGPYEFNYTGGSTGSPFKYVLDKKTLSNAKAFNYYLWNHFLDYRFGDKILVIGGSSLGSNKGLKKRVYNYLQNKIFIPGDIISAQQNESIVSLILKGNYKFIYGYPSAILRYINLLTKRGLSFNSSVKGVITTSETLNDNDKKKIENFFKCKVLNIYGANDGGVVAGSINNREFLYNGTECFIEEQILKNGETELLLTNLSSRVFPFVRYQVGDLGKIIKSSKLGPFVLGDIKGRTRDFFYNKNGDIFHGSLINKLVKDIEGILQYQLVQKKDYSIDFYILLEKKDDQKNTKNILLKKLMDLINDDSIKINLIYTSEFIMGKNGKHKLVISNVD